MKHTALSCITLLVSLLLLSISCGHAASVREVTIDEMLLHSQFVFDGKVVSLEAKENSRKRIHTYVTFAIQDVIKGEYPNPTITLRFLGGTVGDVTMAVSDMEIPAVGEHGIYFVESLERLQVHPFYGWSQGHFIVEPDGNGTDRVMTSNKQPVTEIADDSPVEPMVTSPTNNPNLSAGVARGVTFELKKNGTQGLTVIEFKQSLHEKMGRGNE